jgi:hypothetical protein
VRSRWASESDPYAAIDRASRLSGRWHFDSRGAPSPAVIRVHPAEPQPPAQRLTFALLHNSGGSLRVRHTSYGSQLNGEDASLFGPFALPVSSSFNVGDLRSTAARPSASDGTRARPSPGTAIGRKDRLEGTNAGRIPPADGVLRLFSPRLSSQCFLTGILSRYQDTLGISSRLASRKDTSLLSPVNAPCSNTAHISRANSVCRSSTCRLRGLNDSHLGVI